MASIQFGVSALVIVTCGVALTRFADAMASHTRLGRLWIGTLFLAAATSLPELSVDIAAARRGLPDVAVGDLLGSSLFNLLILAVLDLSRLARGHLLSRAASAHALAGVVGIVLIALAAGSILLGSLANVGSIGWGSLAIAAAYMLCVRLVYCDQIWTAGANGGALEAKRPSPSRLSLRQAVLGFSLTAGGILVAGPVLASSAGELAEQTGLGDTFVGTTLVALATSLPELVTTLTALRIGAIDLAVGNIYGSNALNVFLLAVVDFAYEKPLLSVVSSLHVFTCLATVIMTGIAVLSQLAHMDGRGRAVKPGAWLIIALALGALGVIYSLRDGLS